MNRTATRESTSVAVTPVGKDDSPKKAIKRRGMG
jgi:hypothetical protein